MSTTNDAERLFQEAARAFRDSLSPSDLKEFTEFPSAKEMILELNKRVSTYQKKSRLVGFCRRLEQVSESLSPFFDIIGIFIQANPEVPALVWGALRMVFLLASNFSSFFDKLLVMFEQISDRLPGYAEYYGRLLTRQKLREAETDLPQFESTRILKVLSYIYRDLVQFCQAACQIFGTKKRGIRYQAAVITDIFWKPFDVRFKNILERIETHQALFLSEIQLEESKFTEFQFQKSQRDFNGTHEAITQMELQLSEMRKTILEREEALTARYERISEHIASVARNREPNMHHSGSSPHKISPIFDTTFRQIAKWINASDFKREMHKAQETRLDDTCEWFLTTPSYTAFKSFETTSPIQSKSEIPKTQIMFIQAKPGYGKTILSSLLVEDLARAPAIDVSRESQAPRTLSVLYYHFASERAEECSPTHGLRACLHQIVHHHMKTANILDAVSIIAETDSTGQIHATDEDVRQSLQLLLMHLPPLTLVFDGLDECTTPPDLFRTVYEMCCYTGSKAIFLGRPNFEPPRGCNSYTIINLNSSQNASDIRAYLQPEIAGFKSDGLLPKSSDIKDIVASLADCAQGMFLWARLVIRYLSNTWLSPRERIDTIFDSTMIDGLDNLFEKIIAILERSHPAQKGKVHRIFQVIAISETSFTLPELRQVTAVTPGRVTRDEDLIVDFQNCLPVMCGSLVECDSSGHVRFIHSSFRDYIMESQYFQHSPLAIAKQSSWLTLTTICLSYLTYDIPRGPMTTASSANDQRTIIAECFPLLRYGLNRFQQLNHDIFHGDVPHSKDEVGNAKEVLQALEEWIKQKLCVTAWIEANYLFEQTPTLEPLISTMKVWCLRYETLRARASAILSMYLQLEQDLGGLRNNWAEVLLREPCAIWTSTITAFAESSFWLEQTDTVVTHLDQRAIDSLDFERMSDCISPLILVKSQTAADKITHATVHVIPSSQYISAVRYAATLDGPLSSRREGKASLRELCVGWKAQYQVKDIDSKSTLFSANMDLPKIDVLEALKFPVYLDDQQISSPWLRFRLPVLISADLKRVLILRTLFRFPEGPDTIECKHSVTRTMQSERLRCQSTVEACYPEYSYESMFSPTEDAILFFQKVRIDSTSGESKVRPKTQTLEIWSRTEFPIPGSAIQYAFRGRQRALSLKENTFLFHPSRPLLVFTDEWKASIWYYNETKDLQGCYRFTSQTIEPIAFENDVFLCYYPWTLLLDDKDAGPHFRVLPPDAPRYRNKRVRFDHAENVDLVYSRPFGMVDDSASTSEADPLLFVMRRCVLPERIELLGPHGSERSFHDPSSTSSDVARPILVSQSHVLMTTERREDPLEIKQGGHKSQEILIRSRNGQTTQFGHTPPIGNWEPSTVTLLPIAGSVKVIWDKELQHSYSILDTPSPHLPCLIERTLRSVPLLEDAHLEHQGSSVDPQGVNDSTGSCLTKKCHRTEEDCSSGGAQKKRMDMVDDHS